MPWWYYYNYQRNKPTHTELLPSNLTVVQLDMKLPLLDHAHVTVSTVDSTTAIRKPFLPWIIKSTVPSTKATKQHQKREHPTSILPLEGKPLKGLENFIFHQSIPLGEEISSCLYDSCTTGAGRALDAALPPSKEVDSTVKKKTSLMWMFLFPYHQQLQLYYWSYHTRGCGNQIIVIQCRIMELMFLHPKGFLKSCVACWHLTVLVTVFMHLWYCRTGINLKE